MLSGGKPLPPGGRIWICEVIYYKVVTKLDKTAKNVVQLLKAAGKTAASAESCTGGLLSGAITSAPGASDVFGFGVCTYANEAKEKLLGVKAETLEKYGAVSEQTAIEMAAGVRRLSGADFGISTTGIAGPGGGTPDKPVGTVWIGVSTAERTFALKNVFDGSPFPEFPDKRSAIRMEAVMTALVLLALEISDDVDPLDTDPLDADFLGIDKLGIDKLDDETKE